MTQSPSEEILKLDNQLCFALYASSRAMMNTYRGLLAELRLTFPQYLVMLVLWEAGPCTVKALGQALYLDSGTLSPLLRRLESAQLIARVRGTRDERLVEVHLTETGQALKQKALPVATEFACRTTLATQEFAQLRGQLRTLATTLSTGLDDPTSVCE